MVAPADTGSFPARTFAKPGNPLARVDAILQGIIEDPAFPESDRAAFDAAIVGILLRIIRSHGEMSPEELRPLDGFFSRNFGLAVSVLPREQLEKLIHDGDTKALLGLPLTLRLQILRAGVELAFADEVLSPAERHSLGEIAAELTISENVLERVIAGSQDDRKRRSHLLRSSAGLIAALVVIAIFIVTATLVKSVLFGLMLSCFFLPLQQWYQRRFFPSPAGKALLGFLHALGAPIRVPAAAIRARLQKPQDLSETEKAAQAQAEERKARDRDISRACQATLLSVLAVLLLLGGTVSGFSASYVSGAHAALSNWVETNVGEPTDSKGWRRVLSGSVERLEKLRPRLEAIPGFQQAQNAVVKHLEDDENRAKLTSFFVSRLGGIFSAATSLLGAAATFLLHAMLTVFFFSFFLQKLAAFQSSESAEQGGRNFGRYVIEGLFRSRWLPQTTPETLTEAESIINSIIDKLQTWVKGYLWIIIIETTIYSTIFLLLGVPYWPVLGIIAGMTVLLPFIGPVASGALTITVTYALEQPSITVVVLLLLTYVVMNAIVEQMFLYPMFIGEALGLNALETIIVVLLGGLFAGLTGMIFAVPVASVTKSLIPRIYSCWQPAGNEPPTASEE